VSDPAKIEQLKRQHANLDDAIDGEAQRPMPDQSAISELKKEKLKLKDEIANLERS
jgi:hypothetical protein